MVSDLKGKGHLFVSPQMTLTADELIFHKVLQWLLESAV